MQPGDQTYLERPGHAFALNKDFDSVKASDYDGLYLPGGRAPEHLRLNPEIVSIVKYFFEANKPVAAICHGVQLLTAAGVLQGRTATGYPACGPEVTLAGATYEEVPADKAVVEGNLVTSPAWPGHGDILAKFVDLLGYKVVAK